MKRGTVVTAILSNDYGKARPALIVQSDIFSEHPSVTLLPITSDLEYYPQLRIRVEPTPSNGLRKTSDIMVDKIQSLPLKRIGEVIGVMDSEIVDQAMVSLALFLDM